jgi:hypothetical protein
MARTKIGSNMSIAPATDGVVLFSYETPVAAHIHGRGFIRTNEFHSVTTSTHINKWIRSHGGEPKEATKVEQSEINALL